MKHDEDSSDSTAAEGAAMPMELDVVSEPHEPSDLRRGRKRKGWCSTELPELEPELPLFKQAADVSPTPVDVAPALAVYFL